jgi:arylsulfatase A-like enzyme
MGGSISDEEQSLAELLKAEGYATAAFVRNPLIELDSRGLERGFDTFFCPEAVTETQSSEDDIRPIAERQLYAQDIKAEELLGRVQEWIEQNRENQPFFIWVHLFDPHDPYAPPAPYDSMFDKGYKGQVTGDLRRTVGTDMPVWEEVEHNPPPDDYDHIVALYDGEIRYTSAQVGAFLKTLEARDLAENTLIVVSADHGESLGEHNLWGHGLSLYEPELHIPLIMVMPGKIPEGLVIRQPVESASIVPTILSLAEVKGAGEFAGKDLNPHFKNQGDTDGSAFALWGSLSSIRTERWKLIASDEGRFELYDLQNDPGEKKNIMSDNPGLLRSLDHRLKGAAARRIVFPDKNSTQPLQDNLKSLGYLK